MHRTPPTAPHHATSTLLGQQQHFNLQLNPLGLATSRTTGVEPLEVPAEHARTLAAFLMDRWDGGRLKLPNGTDVRGWGTYPRTLQPHNEAEQQENTLSITSALLPAFRDECPAFANIESYVADWVRNRFGHDVETDHSNVFRQSRKTLRSTGFGVHQAGSHPVHNTNASSSTFPTPSQHHPTSTPLQPIASLSHRPFLLTLPHLTPLHPTLSEHNSTPNFPAPPHPTPDCKLLRVFPSCGCRTLRIANWSSTPLWSS
jgi:hypothetical protein